LGAGACYMSPVLEARPGSPHGYDVINPARLNPEIGTEDEFTDLARRFAARGMGLVMDVVPNHMCIDPGQNRFFDDVLENGPSSPSARYSDNDWDPPKGALTAKVLLPILGEQFGRALENKQVQVRFEGGSFFVYCYDSIRLPLAPRSFTQVLEPPLRTLQQAL